MLRVNKSFITQNNNKANNLHKAKYFQNVFTYSFFLTTSRQNNDCKVKDDHYFNSWLF